ncbi:helix-turn-helix domain-containing protein [Candidatus Nitrosocosmicus arcticus]|uniref:Uncharacterized protein n=1 Tax=Candidatus Nitrosocosmicus arcticus TaxID=2035267 RepID=A0A557SYV9_9ARCH|nr:helix-turn-helix domain-containing protein [Candidatus Nitrosocosmicus arcticus]TVP41787.1 hypothetical protein NARC_10193 [Candidatus Nitrosocosmicus arcticus]
MVLTRSQKKELVIKLYEDGKTTRQIAKELRMSLRDIGIILNEYNKVPDPEKPKSNRARSIEMFKEGKDTIEVLTCLDLEYNEVRKYYGEYLSLKNLTDFINFYREHKQFLPFLLRVVEKMKQYELFENDVNALINCLNQFKNFNITKKQLQHEVNCLVLQKKCLEDEIPNGKIPGLQ